MPDPVAALAMTGATTIVAAMATSAWQLARTRTAALFARRGESPREIETQLDRSAARVDAAGADGEAVRSGQVARWRDDLADLLRDHPDAEEELQALIGEVQPQLPPQQHQWIQNVSARTGGTAFGALGPGSSVHVHYHSGARDTEGAEDIG